MQPRRTTVTTRRRRACKAPCTEWVLSQRWLFWVRRATPGSYAAVMLPSSCPAHTWLFATLGESVRVSRKTASPEQGEGLGDANSGGRTILRRGVVVPWVVEFLRKALAK